MAAELVDDVADPVTPPCIAKLNQLYGSSFSDRAGWDAFHAAVCPSGCGSGHRGGVEGDDGPAVADHHFQPVSGHPVPRQHDSARGSEVEAFTTIR